MISQILDRHVIEAQGYLDCQNILETLGKKNRQRLETACQLLLNQHGVGSYSTLKRIMATIDSDAKHQRPPVPAAATRKPTPRGDREDGESGAQVRSAARYTRGHRGAGA
ncbi:hypothetical protein [Kocuria rhizosphaericola]|uniref:hypothetical protein n=1 Tax=Kocuria rhizosphaericola TaxID=3376284 RepID=UPI0037C12DC1